MKQALQIRGLKHCDVHMVVQLYIYTIHILIINRNTSNETSVADQGFETFINHIGTLYITIQKTAYTTWYIFLVPKWTQTKS